MCAIQAFELANNSENINFKLIKSNYLNHAKNMISKMNLMIKQILNIKLFINIDIDKLKNEQNEIINSMNEIFKNINQINYYNIFEINKYNNKIDVINIKYKSFIELLNSISNYQNYNLKIYQTSKFCICDWFNELVHADFNEQYYYNIEFINCCRIYFQYSI
jgi:ERCC4-type nuclease